MNKIIDHTKMKALMVEKNKKQRDMANHLGISLNSFNNKVNGNRDFTETEINKILKLFETEYEYVFLPH
ncbi:helix-turn-helix transcriptional regulator [Halocella sp. SP3-1]|uniref:helix-turn-helix transcriptional regulator n=1 Tax=Halocella sp. SP3-1 TaxID=2382161 RepID=UPI000F752DD9|nr:helix-turn-helix transcriptional regulator [Halocella sp. SP3-1]AZO96132.1 XRE family transcriptional regulator [Halocella sp. SP3-1]